MHKYFAKKGNITKLGNIFQCVADSPLTSRLFRLDIYSLYFYLNEIKMGGAFEEYYRQRGNKQIDDLRSERQHVSFDIRQMTYLLDGGKEMTMVS